MAFNPTGSQSSGGAQLAIAASTMTGNIWDGELSITQLQTSSAAAQEQHSPHKTTCGQTDLCWAGNDGRLLAVAEDSGDVKVNYVIIVFGTAQFLLIVSS